jgi:hypothetical protein
MRLLEGHAWVTLIDCLACLPLATEMQQVVVIGLMYLSKEVAALYEQVGRSNQVGLCAQG